MSAEPTPCPVTGEPPRRLVQSVDAELLVALWRLEFGVDVRACFGARRAFELYESPTGLHYFAPPVEGDAAFYAAFYRAAGERRMPREGHPREEFRMVAPRVRDGDRVLDVGCGLGAFRHLVPRARYLGLDPYFAARSPGHARAEELGEHLASGVAPYDLVCAFQVIEHLADPLGFARELARAVRPGGLLAVTVPHVPCALTRIPNFLMNAPPHHLSWWTAPALSALSLRLGLIVDTIAPVPWGELDAELYWMERSLSVRTDGVYFRHSWRAHAAGARAFALGALRRRLHGVPKDPGDEGAALLLIARKP